MADSDPAAPVPVPRPRQIPNNTPEETVPSLFRKHDYENFEIVHPKQPEVQNNPALAPSSSSVLSKPVPIPRRTKIFVHDEGGNNRATFYQNVTPAVTAKLSTTTTASPASAGAVRKPSSVRSPNRLNSTRGITTVHNDLRSGWPSSSTTASSIISTEQLFSCERELQPPGLDQKRSVSDEVSVGSEASLTSTNRPPAKTFTRNSGLSQNLYVYSKVLPKKDCHEIGRSPSLGSLRQTNKSEFFFDSVHEINVTSSRDSIPPPTVPAPVLRGYEESSSSRENLYGKLNIIQRTVSSSSEEDNNLLEMLKRIKIRKKTDNCENVVVRSSSVSDFRASVNRIESRRSSSIDEVWNNLGLKSDSWKFYDVTNRSDDQGNFSDEDSFWISAPESTYIGEMETSLLELQPAGPARHAFDEVSISDIIDEFDPLAHHHSLSAIQENTGKDNDLSLLESILSAENYGIDAKESPEQLPKHVQRSDSLLESSTIEPAHKDPTLVSRRKKSRSPSRSIIIHQNLNLPSDSIENLVDEVEIEPVLAVVQPTADLSYPSSSQAPQPSRFASDEISASKRVKFLLNTEINTLNDDKPMEKIPNELPIEPIRNEEDEHRLPSYTEAVGESISLSEPQPGPSSSSKSSVTSKLLNTLKRKASFRSKVDTRTVQEMVPKPLLTKKLINLQGHLLKFPTGMIVDMFNELTPRSVVLKEKTIQTYQGPQPKETLHLKFILSLQSLVQKLKLVDEDGLNLHCFEVVLALPKKEGSSAGIQQLVSNPIRVITSENCGDVKMLRQSYMFGVHKRSDRNLWMAKILQSVTDVFPHTCLAEFTRAGWCYMKKSVTSSWSGAWLLLAKRKLYFFNYQDRQLEQLDLRKARCIGEIESEETIRNLHTEAGPSLFIDCPPYTTLYFIMALPRETQIWKDIIKDAAHNNRSTMHSQQLTKNEVPVIIDKCINFIYAYGSMSEGIYRKSGSSSQINKILQLFKEDAFAVQLTRAEFNEYDVAGALKKFIRDIPASFFGSYTISFISITSLKSIEDKVFSYMELLSRLPKIEYQTLKKLIGHLSFIASLEKHNKMGVANLALIWGSTLMANSSQSYEARQHFNFQKIADVVADLIKLYKNLYTISPEDVKKEQLMLKALQKYHAAAENLLDKVKHSGDLKVWIAIECDTETSRSTANEEKTQINVTITPTKTAADICMELASKTPHEWYQLTLHEVIGDGSLMRPVHYSEKALDIVLKWTYWDDADRKNNYLAVRPTTTLNDVFRHIQQAPVSTPTTELRFADRRTKTLRSYRLQLIGHEIVVLKQVDKKNKDALYEELLKINLGTVNAYLGREAKRDQSSLRWSITLVEHDFKKRTRDAPFIGHILGGIYSIEQILWYSSIFHSLHQEDILPSNDLFFWKKLFQREQSIDRQ